jgi:hypothetical protein
VAVPTGPRPIARQAQLASQSSERVLPGQRWFRGRQHDEQGVRKGVAGRPVGIKMVEELQAGAEALEDRRQAGSGQRRRDPQPFNDVLPASERK